MAVVTEAERNFPSKHQVVLVTGPSGAGRTTALKVLEDLGYEAIDNPPISMLAALVEPGAHPASLALGIDVRNRDYSSDGLEALLLQFRRDVSLELKVLYLSCSEEVLIRRFSETRRRHPLAPTEAPEIGVQKEAMVLHPVQEHADVLIDTSDLTPHDLGRELRSIFGPLPQQGIAISIHSFSYKRGLPHGLDMVFDCRFLRNPYWQAELRNRTGQDPAVATFVATDPNYTEFFEKLSAFLKFLLPAYVSEGKSHLNVGFGCTGGQHRSVAVAESLAKVLADSKWGVSIRHRELELLNTGRSQGQIKVGST